MCLSRTSHQTVCIVRCRGRARMLIVDALRICGSGINYHLIARSGVTPWSRIRYGHQLRTLIPVHIVCRSAPESVNAVSWWSGHPAAAFGNSRNDWWNSDWSVTTTGIARINWRESTRIEWPIARVAGNDWQSSNCRWSVVGGSRNYRNRPAASRCPRYYRWSSNRWGIAWITRNVWHLAWRKWRFSWSTRNVRQSARSTWTFTGLSRNDRHRADWTFTGPTRWQDWTSGWKSFTGRPRRQDRNTWREAFAW